MHPIRSWLRRLVAVLAGARDTDSTSRAVEHRPWRPVAAGTGPLQPSFTRPFIAAAGVAPVAAVVVAFVVGCSDARPITAIDVGVSGVSSPPTRTDAPRLEDLPTAPPAGATPVAAAVVWVADDGAPFGVKSLWIESATGHPRGSAWIAAVRAEPVAVVGDSIAALRSQKWEVPLVACEDCTDCGATSDTAAVMLAVDLTTGGETIITSDDEPGDATDFEARPEVVGLVGEVAFVAEHTSVMSCGALHPFFSDRGFAFDLARASQRSIDPSREQLAELVGASRAPLAEMRRDCGNDEGFEPELHGVVVSFAPGPRPRAIYTMTAPTSYMCGTGPGHYAVAVDLVRDELPEAGIPVVVPSWLGALLRVSKVEGISSPVPRERIERLRTAFRAAPLPPP